MKRVNPRRAVTNTGESAAETPVFAFVSPPGCIERWPYALKAFTRVALTPGETRIVPMTIDRTALQWYDPAIRDWREEAGKYHLALRTDATEAVTIGFII